MNFSELKAEFLARGFDMYTDARAGMVINRSYKRLSNMYRWPFREDGGIGIAPVIVPTLGQVEAVTNQSQGDYPLEESTYKDLTEWYGDLATAGTPIYWYRAYVDDDPIIATYPVSTSDIIGVQFWKKFPDLTGTDTPEVPEDYHMLIVDMAVQMGYRGINAHAMAEAMRIEINQQILEMIEDYLPQQDPLHQKTHWDSSEDW